MKNLGLCFSRIGFPAIIFFVLFTTSCQNSAPEVVATTAPQPFQNVQDSVRMIGLDVISTDAREFATSWHAASNLLVFNRLDEATDRLWMYTAAFDGAKWGRVVPFMYSDTLYDDVDPFWSGDRLYFSRTPKDTSGARDFDIFFSDFDGTNWAEPQVAATLSSEGNQDIFITQAESGNAYYTIFEGMTRTVGLYRKNTKQVEAPATKLSFGVDTFRLTNPAIAPDESYMIVTTALPEGFGIVDLYAVFPTSDPNQWTRPYNLGAKVNSEHVEYAPGISADGTLLFFSSNRPVDGREPKEGIRDDNLYVIALPDLIQKVIRENGIETVK